MYLVMVSYHFIITETVLIPERSVLRPSERPIRNVCATSFELHIKKVAALAAFGVATLLEKVFCKVRVAELSRTLCKSQECELDLWVSRIPVYLGGSRAKEGTEQVRVFLQRLEELVIVEQCIVSQRRLD